MTENHSNISPTSTSSVRPSSNNGNQPDDRNANRHRRNRSVTSLYVRTEHQVPVGSLRHIHGLLHIETSQPLNYSPASLNVNRLRLVSSSSIHPVYDSIDTSLNEFIPFPYQYSETVREILDRLGVLPEAD